MPLFPIPIEEFAGLDLVSDPSELGFSGAIDLLNVDLSSPGVLKNRPGYATYNSGSVSTDRYAAAKGLTRGLIVAFRVGASATVLDLLQDGGSGLASASTKSIASTAGGTKPIQAAVFGTPTDGYAFVLDPTGTGTPYRVTLSTQAWDQPAFTGTAAPDRFSSAVAVTPWDNRLVMAGVNGDGSRVMFSDAPASPLNFPNYVSLAPNRESVTTMAVWQNLLFVFTDKALYTFYGTSTDASGNPEFNYRRTQTSTGGALPGCTAAGPDGLYYATNRGIFRTTGGAPVAVSRAIEPVVGWTEAVPSPPFYTGSLLGPRGMAYVNGHIIVAGTPFTSNGSTATLTGGGMWALLNLESGAWTTWQMAAGGDTIALDYDNSATNGDTSIYFANLAGDLGFSRMRWRGILTAATTDNGSAITSRYQSGFDNLAPPRRFAAHYLFGNTRKRFRKWKVTGTGNVTLGIAHEMGAVGPTQALTLGVSPAVKDAWFNKAVRGQLVSYRLSSTTPFSVNKLTAYLAGSEPPLLGDPSDA